MLSISFFESFNFVDVISCCSSRSWSLPLTSYSFLFRFIGGGASWLLDNFVVDLAVAGALPKVVVRTGLVEDTVEAVTALRAGAFLGAGFAAETVVGRPNGTLVSGFLEFVMDPFAFGGNRVLSISLLEISAFAINDLELVVASTSPAFLLSAVLWTTKSDS